MKRKTFAIDFDGTLAHYDGWKGALHLGQPYDDAIKFVNQAIALGHEVIVHTCRTTIVTPSGSVDRDNHVSQGDMIDKLKKWLSDAGANEKVKIWSSTGKPHCDVYMDDKAQRVRPKDNPEIWSTLLDTLE